MTLRSSILFVFALAAGSTLACSSNGGGDDGAGAGSGSDACSAAEKRYSDCKPGSVLSINGPCTGGNLQRAECVNSSSCAEVDQCILSTGSGGAGGTTGSGGLPGVGGGSAGTPGSGGLPGVGGGSAGTPGSGGGSAGTPGSAGGNPGCADLSGSYVVTGTCDITACKITQSGCTANFECNNGAESYAGAVGGNSVTFSGFTGTCQGVLSGDTLMGSCTDPLGLATCQYTAKR